MSRMETFPDHMQGQARLYHAGESDMSDVSYQASRQSSINTEPMTLDSEEIDSAKDEAKHILENVRPEEAMNIFTKDLRVENGEATTEKEMGKKRAPSKLKVGGEMVSKTVDNHFEELLQKATAVVEANEKLTQATAKGPGSSKEEFSEGEKLV